MRIYAHCRHFHSITDMANSINKLFEDSFKVNWDRPALSDYNGATISYADLARRIAHLHIFFEVCNIKKGDKIALCARNMSNWAVAYLATMTYGAVVVPLLHEFKPSSIHHLVNHSDSRFMFVGDVIWENLQPSEMPGIEACITLNNFQPAYARTEEIAGVKAKVDEIFAQRYPNFGPDDIKYYEDQPEELALISYTSGSTGFSKGVMLPFRSVYYNTVFGEYAEKHINNQSKIVSMLPSAHMYGMMYEVVYEMTRGAHVYFLTRLPSPKVILQALGDIKPELIVTVPLILEKIYKSMLLPFISKSSTKMFLSLPVIDQVVLNKIKKSLTDALGGNFSEVLVGGAALNREVEAFLHRIGFRFTVGYGMTECGPIISYSPWNVTKVYSCGRPAPDVKVRIDSADPENVPGEILVQGRNVFMGYYKNPTATEAALQDGWLHTGDMGVMDKDGFLYIKGRSKTMILGPSGQNIYPEEIESSINNLPYVSESLVISDHGVLTALIYPDFDQLAADQISNDRIQDVLKEKIQVTNMEMPDYCKITRVEIFPEEFEKTPKRSIKRYLYQRG